jgi:hypothetical protein
MTFIHIFMYCKTKYKCYRFFEKQTSGLKKKKINVKEIIRVFYN